jgi:serine/threonine-protein phosphatase PP1 catalytic subunit
LIHSREQIAEPELGVSGKFKALFGKKEPEPLGSGNDLGATTAERVSFSNASLEVSDASINRPKPKKMQEAAKAKFVFEKQSDPSNTDEKISTESPVKKPSTPSPAKATSKKIEDAPSAPSINITDENNAATTSKKTVPNVTGDRLNKSFNGTASAKATSASSSLQSPSSSKQSIQNSKQSVNSDEDPVTNYLHARGNVRRASDIGLPIRETTVTFKSSSKDGDDDEEIGAWAPSSSSLTTKSSIFGVLRKRSSGIFKKEIKIDLDEIIGKLLRYRPNNSSEAVKNSSADLDIDPDDIIKICQKSKDLFMSQPMLLELASPLHIVGMMNFSH